jgi:hypothetical protein
MTSPRTAPQAGHRKAVEPGIPEITGYLQEILGQKLIAHIANESDPSTVAMWAAGQIPRAEHDQRLRCAYETVQLLITGESPDTVRAWFLGLNPQLDDQSPAQSIREGDFREVLVAAKAFLAGG